MPTLTIRGVDQDVYDRFRLAAKMRDMTQGEYLAALVALHDQCRAENTYKVAHGLPNSLGQVLKSLGLETVEG